MKRLFWLVLGVFLIGAFGEEESEKKEEGMNVQMSGYGIWDIGYVGEMQDVTPQTWKSEPFTDLIGGIRLSAMPTDNMTIVVNPEMKNRYLMPMIHGIDGGAESKQSAVWEAYMEEASAEWTIGDPKHPNFNLGLGYIIYKENPNTRIFGDYLFRSMIYPSVIFTKFNYPQTQIFGLTLGHHLGNFNHNVFVLSETKNYPYYDISLAYTANFSMKNMVEVGAGAYYRSAIPFRPSKTTPKAGADADNVWKEIGLQTGTLIYRTDSLGAPRVNKLVTIERIAGRDSSRVIIYDSLKFAGEELDTIAVKGIGANGLRSGLFSNPAFADFYDNQAAMFYPELGMKENDPFSFAGAIVMARLAVNPLGFMETNPLGKDALKVYMETALLGVKDYKGLYEKKSERMPIMFGINLPNFNALDVLSAEVEYFPNSQLPTHEFRSFVNVPQPGDHKGRMENAWDPDRRKKDDMKWGIIARKSFRGFSLVGQVGNDHTRMTDKDGEAYMELFTRPAHWYAQVRFIGGISN